MSNKNLLNEATIRRFMKLANMEPLAGSTIDRLSEMHCVGGRDDDMDPMEEDKAYTAKKEKPGADMRKGAEKRGAEGTLAKTPGHGRVDYANEAAHEDDEPGARDYMEEADDAEKLDATERELGDEDAEADRERDEMDDMEDEMGDMEADEEADIPADVRDRIEDALAGALEMLAGELDLDMDVEREDDEPEMDAMPADEPMPEPPAAMDVEVDVEEEDLLENVQVVDDTDLINEVAKRVTARLVKAMAKK
jgi:hypothetical protein